MNNQKIESIGSKILISQQQNNHQRRLRQINNGNVLSDKTINENYLKHLANNKQLHPNKKSLNQQIDHHFAIKHLIQRLNSPKTHNDRLKDPNDFIAYPTLFFRKQHLDKSMKRKSLKSGKSSKQLNQNVKWNKKTKNKSINDQRFIKDKKQRKPVKINKNLLKKVNQSPSVHSQLPYHGLTVQKVKNHLPMMEKFEEKDIDYFAEKLTQIIFKYNMNSLEDMEFLFACIEQCLPDNYPEHFIVAIQNMFKDIVEQFDM